jgi:hypothetical protein
MPYMKNGNARSYILKHPECNRLLIVGDFLFIPMMLVGDHNPVALPHLAGSCVPPFAENYSW